MLSKKQKQPKNTYHMISFVKSSGTGKIKGNGDRKEQWLSQDVLGEMTGKRAFWNSGTFCKCTII